MMLLPVNELYVYECGHYLIKGVLVSFYLDAYMKAKTQLYHSLFEIHNDKGH